MYQSNTVLPFCTKLLSLVKRLFLVVSNKQWYIIFDCRQIFTNFCLAGYTSTKRIRTVQCHGSSNNFMLVPVIIFIIYLFNNRNQLVSTVVPANFLVTWKTAKKLVSYGKTAIAKRFFLPFSFIHPTLLTLFRETGLHIYTLKLSFQMPSAFWNCLPRSGFPNK